MAGHPGCWTLCWSQEAQDDALHEKTKEKEMKYKILPWLLSYYYNLFITSQIIIAGHTLREHFD